MFYGVSARASTGAGRSNLCTEPAQQASWGWEAKKDLGTGFSVFCPLEKWGESQKGKMGKGRKSRGLSTSVYYLTLPSPSFRHLALASYIPTAVMGLLARMHTVLAFTILLPGKTPIIPFLARQSPESNPLETIATQAETSTMHLKIYFNNDIKLVFLL